MAVLCQGYSLSTSPKIYRESPYFCIIISLLREILIKMGGSSRGWRKLKTWENILTVITCKKMMTVIKVTCMAWTILPEILFSLFLQSEKTGSKKASDFYRSNLTELRTTTKRNTMSPFKSKACTTTIFMRLIILIDLIITLGFWGDPKTPKP